MRVVHGLLHLIITVLRPCLFVALLGYCECAFLVDFLEQIIQARLRVKSGCLAVCLSAPV